LTVLAAAAWARAIGLLQGTNNLYNDIIYILIGDVRCNLYWGLETIGQRLCCGKLTGYFFAKMYSFQVGFAMM
jgi:hypothetical protein